MSKHGLFAVVGAVVVVSSVARTQTSSLESRRLKRENEALHELVARETLNVERFMASKIVRDQGDGLDRVRVMELGWRMKGFKEGRPRLNPLLTEDYQFAVDALLEDWSSMMRIEVEAVARRQLDDMIRTIMIARGALRAGQSEDRRTAEQLKKENEVLLTLSDRLLRAQSGRILLSVSGPRTNQLLSGGDYERALNGLFDELVELELMVERAGARKILDNLDRFIVEARRALWERERARKKGEIDRLTDLSNVPPRLTESTNTRYGR